MSDVLSALFALLPTDSVRERPKGLSLTARFACHVSCELYNVLQGATGKYYCRRRNTFDLIQIWSEDDVLFVLFDTLCWYEPNPSLGQAVAQAGPSFGVKCGMNNVIQIGSTCSVDVFNYPPPLLFNEVSQKLCNPF